jgi:hypothetical protein
VLHVKPLQDSISRRPMFRRSAAPCSADRKRQVEARFARRYHESIGSVRMV